MSGTADSGSYPPEYYVALCLWIMSAFTNTCYSFIWDIEMDWGLFAGKHFLQDQLIYSRKVCVCVFVLQCVWHAAWQTNFSDSILAIKHTKVVIKFCQYSFYTIANHLYHPTCVWYFIVCQ